MRHVVLVALALLVGVITTLQFVPERDDPVMTHETLVQPSRDDQTASFAGPRIENSVVQPDEPSDEPDNRPTEPIDQTRPVVTEEVQVGRAADATDTATAIEVPILPGIELVGDIRVIHAMLEGEATDTSWAIPMEAEIYDYFFANSQELSDNFSVPYVTCRTSICEIQAIGYGENSLQVWEAATAGLESQPWAEEFIQVLVGGNPIGPDSGGLVVVLIRANGDSAVQGLSAAVAAI